MDIKDIAFYFGLLLGSALLLSAVFVFVTRQAFGLGGVVLIAFGSFLVGWSIWTSFEVSVGADGSVTAKYTQRITEDIGAKAADFNGSIELLKRRIDELTQDVSALKTATPAAARSQEQIAKREVRDQEFARNSDYSVLVFYKSAQKETASQITKKLLSVGFRSSATPTDLREAVKQFDANTAWVVYTKKGQDKLPVLKELFATSFNNVQFVYRESPSDLRTGDVQILLF